MKTLLLLTILLTSHFIMAQTHPVLPIPGCEEIQRVGVQQPTGYLTNYWVSGHNNLTDNSCESISIRVSGTMYAGDIAYGVVDVDLFSQQTVDEVDFEIELNHVFESLSPGNDITVAKLWGEHRLLGELRLRKTMSFSEPVQTFAWVLIVKWQRSQLEYTEDFFPFEDGETIHVNYIWDDADPELPVSMLSLGHGRISIYPYQQQGGSGEQNGLIAYNQNLAVSPQVITFDLGIVNGEVVLVDGDQIKFDLNLYQGSDLY